MLDQTASAIINKVWNYTHVLRDDGVGRLCTEYKQVGELLES